MALFSLSFLSLARSLSFWNEWIFFLTSLKKTRTKKTEKNTEKNQKTHLLGGRRRRPRRRQTHRDLERVVDAPLQPRERPDHDDAQREAARHQRDPAHLLDDLARGDALVGVELGDEVVRRVRDDRAEDSRDVARGERDGELLLLGALGLGLGNDVLVESLKRF